jgi:hypothetical protein
MTTLSASHFVRGQLVEGDDVRYRSRDLGADFVTPAIDLDALILPRSELPPLLGIKISKIIDFLVETGDRLRLDRNPYLQECLELIAATNPLPRRVVENLYREAPYFLNRQLLETIVDSNFADREALDGLGRAGRPVRKEGRRPSFSASYGSHAGRERAVWMCLFDRAGCACQGGQHFQDALE